MLHILWNVFLRGFFTVNLLPIVLLFSRKLNKRPHFPLRLILGILFCLVCSQFTPNVLFSGLYYLIAFVALTLLCLFTCEVSAVQALYCTACAYLAQHISYCLYQICFRPETLFNVTPLYFLWTVVICLLIDYFVVSRLIESGEYEFSGHFLLASMFIILLLVLALSIQADQAISANGPGALYYICVSYDCICCIFVLLLQVIYKNQLKKQREHDLDQQLWLKQKELYYLRQGDVDRLNLLCHDLKKQVESLRLFADAEGQRAYCDQVMKTIQAYDAHLETGSKVLDVLLSQKNLTCMEHHIDLTCVADGKRMNFINAVDLYTILGNAIDNAIESVTPLSDPDKRVVSVSIWTKGQMLLMQIENYCENPAIRFADGLPVTTKNAEEGHGYGLRSVRSSVERYGGSMDISTRNELFSLTILIPCPAETA